MTEPKLCKECARPMRGQTANKDEHPGTVKIGGLGLCNSCYQTHRRILKDPKLAAKHAARKASLAPPTLRTDLAPDETTILRQVDHHVPPEDRTTILSMLGLMT